MTHEKFRQWTKIFNIVASIFVPLIVLSGIFYEVIYSIEDDIADGMFGFFVFILFTNGGLALGTFIYMLVKKKFDLLSRLIWMVVNQILLSIATLISVIMALSGVY